MIINDRDPDGISTVKLFEKIGSTAMIKLLRRVEKQDLIRREEVEEPGPGQSHYKYNIITEKGKELLSELQYE